jgi:hypothetical protein
VEATAKAREEGLELRLGGRLMLRRRGKGDGQRAGKKEKKRIKTRCRVNPDNQKEKCSTSSQITGNVKEILRV